MNINENRFIGHEQAKGDNMVVSKIEAMLNRRLITGQLIGQSKPTRWKLLFPDIGLEIVAKTLSHLGNQTDKHGISDVQFVE